MSPDVHCFRRALELAYESADAENFGLQDVHRVLAIWQRVESGRIMFGYDVMLTRERRRYLQYSADKLVAAREESVHIRAIAVGDGRDAIESSGDWSDQVDLLNKALGLT
jgi:hypothetical protein